MSFHKLFWNKSLRSFWPINLVSLDPFHDHLEQENLWSVQLQQLSLEKNKKKQQKQLSAPVPDRELFQLHLHQLYLQDPDSAISRQLPEETLSTASLQTAAWPAATLTDNLSFSKQKLSEQDLSNISLDKFFPENFGNQLSEKQLQQNLSTDQRQLQENKLTQNNFQQLSLEPAQLYREDLEQRACNNLCQEELDRQPCLSELLLCHLGFPEDSFRTACREQPLQEAA